MKFNTFLGATMVGILPCALFLSYMGSQLTNLLSISDWEPGSLVLPLTGMAFLALIPLACLYLTFQSKFVETGASSVGRGSRPSRPEHSKSIALEP
jgi:hypothetical protein